MLREQLLSLSGAMLSLTERGLKAWLEAASLRKAMRCNSVSQDRVRSRRIFASLASVRPQGTEVLAELSAGRAGARRRGCRLPAGTPGRAAAGRKAVFVVAASLLAWPA